MLSFQLISEAFGTAGEGSVVGAILWGRVSWCYCGFLAFRVSRVGWGFPEQGGAVEAKHLIKAMQAHCMVQVQTPVLYILSDCPMKACDQ